MTHRAPNLSLALIFALTLTLTIPVVKGGALQWVSLTWVFFAGLGALILATLSMKTSAKAEPGLLAVSTIGKKTLLVILALFQFWVLCHYLLFAADKSASLEQLLIGLGMFFFLCIWSVAVYHPKALNHLYTALILSALIQSLYGLAIYLSGTNLLLWMPKLYYLDRPTGFFVNANHFAAYVTLAIILCLSHKLSHPTTRKAVGPFKWIDELYSPRNVTLALLCMTLIASKSLGAILSLAAVLAVMAIKQIWEHENRKTVLLSGFIMSLIAGVFFLSLDYALIEQEIAGLAHTFNRRAELSAAAFTMWQDHWVLGVGGGSFYSQFSPYRTLEIGNSYYNYAHNDILQFWIEYGVLGVLILSSLLWVAMRDNLRVLKTSKSGIRATFAHASIYSTLAVAIHSLVDFPLHIPGFSVCYLTVISINSLHDWVAADT